MSLHEVHETPTKQSISTEKISNNIYSKDKFLDLSNLGLKAIPDEIYEADHVEYLYLADNQIMELPSKFYISFPKLKLLDLRFNEFVELSGDIQHLVNLEIVLLDGNSIEFLPNEISLLTKLHGLNLGSNPIKHPSSEIICKGLKSILKELNNLYFNRKSTDNSDNDSQSRMNNNKETNWNIPNKYLDRKIHKPKLYHEIHQSFKNNQNKSSLSRKKHQTQSERHNHLVQLFPEPISIESIEQKMIDQMRLNKIKEVKQKRESSVQKLRDKTAVSDWREDSRDLQYLKQREQASKLPLEIKLEADSRVLGAPYKLEKQHLETISGHDLSLQKEINLPKPVKPQPLDKEFQLMLEVEKRAKEKSLQTRIRSQVDSMSSKTTKPKGTAKEELENAKRDLEIIVNLQKELQSNMSII